MRKVIDEKGYWVMVMDRQTHRWTMLVVKLISRLKTLYTSTFSSLPENDKTEYASLNNSSDKRQFPWTQMSPFDQIVAADVADVGQHHQEYPQQLLLH